MRFARNVKILKVQWDSAPVASVFFLLVMMLLLQQNFIFPPGIRIDLPTAQGFPGIQRPSIFMTVDASGQAYFADQKLSDQELQRELRRVVQMRESIPTLVIHSDRNLPVGRLTALMELAKDSGVLEVGLAAKVPFQPSFPSPSLPKP